MAKIPWSRIREAFDGQWIELVDSIWDPHSTRPVAGKIRHFGETRSELIKKIANSDQIDDSVVLFVGPSLPPLRMKDARLPIKSVA